ncbi:MAG TPA: GntR family transcriptional regulator [Solirubrobacteraceae bacterium]|nr:GntR family transcriptional regulator [Solirubrobacteraceae bacterium]
MSAIEPLPRRSAVDELAAALRTRILDGDLDGGERLREQELTDAYDVARHTVRAALRALQAEGLVRIEPNRGAHVARLGKDEVEGLYELRTALEVEAARLALDRHDGRLPQPVHAAAAKLTKVCGRKTPRWADVIDAHDALHAALVAASESARIIRAHHALAGETRLFMVQLRPSWTLARMAEEHEQLLDDLERYGPDALRPHLRESADAVIALL